MYKKVFLIFFSLSIGSCNSDSEIRNLLNSKDKDSIIKGARKAGIKRKKDFVPLLLYKAYDWRTSTNFNFKGVSVFQAKMEALEKIYKVKPPSSITDIPDSTIIKFYTEIYNKDSKK